MGRFMSTDPGWMFAVDPTNPQSWNLYSYALDSPLKYIDPTGMILCDYGSSDNGGEDFEDADTADECTSNGGSPVTDKTTVTVNANGSGACSGDCPDTTNPATNNVVANICGKSRTDGNDPNATM